MSDRELIEANVELIAERAPHLHLRVYEVFFAEHPEAEELFGSYGDDQHDQMLTETLTAATELLEGASWTESNVRAMGRRHGVEYLVPEQMYVWWTDAILVALEEASGADWSDALGAAWGRVFDRLNELMLNYAA